MNTKDKVFLHGIFALGAFAGGIGTCGAFLLLAWLR
jgi:hypothetical protein